jgi:proteasome accessory factor B
MERTERLLDLVALLLDAPEPITWAQLREAFPEDYAQGSTEATERKFERDKAELLELGIPLTYETGDDDQHDGYVLARDAYYLPDVGFTQEETATLYAAGSAALASGAFPGRQDLQHALRKIAFFSEDALPTPRVRLDLGDIPESAKVAEHLELLWGALAARKWVELTYASPRAGSDGTRRRVDPYGLALRRGIWSLVGYCHLRQGLRTFHLHRIRSLTPNASRPRSPDFEIPADFKLDAHVAQFPWQHRIHAPVTVTLELGGDLAARALRLFPDGKALPSDTAGLTRLEITTTYQDGLLRYALSLAPECRVLAPEDTRTRFRAMAERVLSLHQEPE